MIGLTFYKMILLSQLSFIVNLNFYHYKYTLHKLPGFTDFFDPCMHHTWIDSASPCCRFDCRRQDSTLFFASVKFPVKAACEPCERPFNRLYPKKQELIYFPMWFFIGMNFKVVILASSASSYLGENAVSSYWREGLGSWFSWWSGCYECLRTWIWTPEPM